jgi:hypothetical protein
MIALAVKPTLSLDHASKRFSGLLRVQCCTGIDQLSAFHNGSHRCPIRSEGEVGAIMATGMPTGSSDLCCIPTYKNWTAFHAVELHENARGSAHVCAL